MFPNLTAEQARRGYTDADMASKLNMSRDSYIKKKKNGTFRYGEIQAMCEIFSCEYGYLLSEKIAVPKTFTEIAE